MPSVTVGLDRNISYIVADIRSSNNKAWGNYNGETHDGGCDPKSKDVQAQIVRVQNVKKKILIRFTL